MPGTASYSANPPITGFPSPQTAQNAVGIPPLPSSTAHPSSLSSLTYAAADRYSLKAGSARRHISMWKSESHCLFSSTKLRAACFSLWILLKTVTMRE